LHSNRAASFQVPPTPGCPPPGPEPGPLAAALRNSLFDRLTDDSPSHIEFSLGHNVASAAEVDEIMIQVAKAGAEIVKPAQATFWGGYAGYFQDPDGHIWEVVFNPAFV